MKKIRMERQVLDKVVDERPKQMEMYMVRWLLKRQVEVVMLFQAKAVAYRQTSSIVISSVVRLINQHHLLKIT